MIDGKKTNDPFLDERLTKYNRWLIEKRISFASRVIPVAESLKTKQWILPTEQVAGILSAAKSVALQKCICRTHYKRCDNPLEVCFVLNEFGDKFVAKGMARHVGPDEAMAALRLANESGLVHLALYMPDHQVCALCSCCPCCCHEFQIIKLTGRQDIMVKSEYVSTTNADLCAHCGKCVERCQFGARSLLDGKMGFDADACLGCGLCVTTCPAGAAAMQGRESEIICQ